MRYLIMTNGDYGEIDWYKPQAGNFDRTVAVDGGALAAVRIGLAVDWLIGDMDSIEPADRHRLMEAGAKLQVFPTNKDYTDTYLALELAESQGADQIVIWGGCGTRLDHTVSNLLSAAYFTMKGVEITFDSPSLTIYLVADRLVLSGHIGDTVSVISLGGQARGVSEKGMKWPLERVEMDRFRQTGISNLIAANQAVIEIEEGMLAVFHYHRLPE